MAVDSLPQLYELMHATIPVRRALTRQILASQAPDEDEVHFLQKALADLEAIPRKGSGHRLVLDGEQSIDVELSYEIGELQKDLVFLEQGEEALLGELARRHPRFRDEVEEGFGSLDDGTFQTFVTDRDGTVNNYCGRYGTSVQSVYNAVFLTRFARARTAGAVVLTSAPLDDTGVADMAVTSSDTFVVAGSKGREYFDTEGQRRRFPLEAGKQKRLDEFNQHLDQLLETPGNEVFRMIGSGLQQKFGETTIARQDIGGTIPSEEAERFLREVHRLARSIDPDETVLHVEDTGLDVEVLLTVDDEPGGAARDFDKGDGLRFLNEDLKLGMDRGACLVCGDTDADLAMLDAALELAPETRAVFVTEDEALKGRVRERLADAPFLSQPGRPGGAVEYPGGRLAPLSVPGTTNPWPEPDPRPSR